MVRAGGKPVLLITGGGGMVGRNLLAHPTARNWKVLTPPSAEVDLCDAGAIGAYIRQHRPDAVIHAAGIVGGIHANMSAPVKFLAANSEMGINLVSACLDAKVKTLINLASSCMYPKDIGHHLSENLILTGPLEPTNEGYALAKILTMRLCEYAMRENSEINYKTLIPCNLYGLWDKFDPRHSHLVPAIIHKIHQAKLQDQKEVEIWGDGTARREFMFAGDLADAVMRAVDSPENLPAKLNIGLGHDYSINEYYKIAAQIIGWNGQFRHDLSRPVGMKQKLLSVKLQTSWGWKPATSLEDGIRLTYQYYLREHCK